MQAEKDSKIRVRHRQLELDRFDLDAQARSLYNAREASLLKAMSASLSAHYEYITKGNELLAPLKETVCDWLLLLLLLLMLLLFRCCFPVGVAVQLMLMLLLPWL